MYINHPVLGVFEANCEFICQKKKGKSNKLGVFIYATRDISPGMELFVEYGASYFQGRDIVPLTKALVENFFGDVYDKGNLGTNLRLCSGLLPQLSDWVTIAQTIIIDRRQLKAKAQREREGKKKEKEGKKKNL